MPSSSYAGTVELAEMAVIFDVAGKGIYPNGVFLIPKKEG